MLWALRTLTPLLHPYVASRASHQHMLIVATLIQIPYQHPLTQSSLVSSFRIIIRYPTPYPINPLPLSSLSLPLLPSAQLCDLEGVLKIMDVQGTGMIDMNDFFEMFRLCDLHVS